MTDAGSRRPSLKDVAREAGVSYQTVSRVINGGPRVAATTRARVLASIAELGYRRNEAARALVPSRSRTIGVIADASPRYGPVSTDGIVTYPGPARETLGLQWRIGASLQAVQSAIETYVAPRSTVVLGVEQHGELCASLIIDFNDDHRITAITTADPSRMDIHGDPAELVDRLVSWGAEAATLARALAAGRAALGHTPIRAGEPVSG